MADIMEKSIFDEIVLAKQAKLIEWRRHLHQNPEISFKEYKTTDFVENTLRVMGVDDIERPTKTGLIAHIYGTKHGNKRTAGIRADIDALPMHEEALLPYASRNEEAMHSCGHDGHTAILLALAECLMESRESFCGEARLIFQHAEELPPGGAIELVKAGAAKGLDAVLGLHLSSNFDTGVFGIKSGVLTANVDRFDIHIYGKGGHCAFPEQCADPVLAAAETVCALQSIVSRRIGAMEPAVVSICRMEAGTAYNIIPEEAHISASVRSFGEETRSLIHKEAEKIARGIAEANGVRSEFEWMEGYPSVVNCDFLAETAQKLIKTRFGDDKLQSIGCIMPGEDFPYFAENCMGFFVELGTRNAEKGCDMPHHNPKYKMDEDALLYGLQYELDMLKTLLSGEDLRGMPRL